ARRIVSEEDAALLTQVGALGRIFQEWQRLDPGAAALGSLQEQAVSALQELQSALSRYADGIDLDPARLRELEERLNLVQTLKRKYGSTVADVIRFGEDAQRKLQSLEQRDAELARLNTALHKVDAELRRAGQELSAQRRKLLPSLTRAVEK